MKKLIIIITTITSVSCSQSKEVVQALEEVQYIKSWINEDLNSGVMDSTYAEYYLEALNKTENLLIKEITN
jgi:hypothetical protein